MKFIFLSLVLGLSLTQAFARTSSSDCSVKVVVDLETGNANYDRVLRVGSELKEIATNAILEAGCAVAPDNTNQNPSAILDITGFEMGDFNDFAISLEKDSLDVMNRKQVYVMESSKGISHWARLTSRSVQSEQFIKSVKRLIK